MLNIIWHTVKYATLSLIEKSRVKKHILLGKHVPGLVQTHFSEKYADICVLFVSSQFIPFFFSCSSACLPVTNGGLWSLGAWGGIRCTEEARSSSGFKPRGHRQRRAVISLGWRMNMFTWDKRKGENWLYCFLQPAVASQYTFPPHTSWKWI